MRFCLCCVVNQSVAGNPQNLNTDSNNPQKDSLEVFAVLAARLQTHLSAPIGTEFYAACSDRKKCAG